MSAVADGPPPPVACTLGAEDISGRLDEWNALLDGVIARHPLPDGIRLEFASATDVGGIARLAAAEQHCCRFFSFTLTIDGPNPALEVHAPPDATGVVVALFGAAR